MTPHLELHKMMLVVTLSMSSFPSHLVHRGCVVHGHSGLLSIIPNPNPNVLAAAFDIGIRVLCITPAPNVERHLEPTLTVEVRLREYFSANLMIRIPSDILLALSLRACTPW